jgi:uncharacterized membrane protein (DUF4010 family)
VNAIDLDALLSQLWLQFLLVGLFGFLTGLEFRAYRADDPAKLALGSARTYTLTAVLGFVLFALDHEFRLFLAGMAALAVFYGLFYYRKLTLNQPGSLQIIAGLIVYSFGPVSQLLPIWFLVLVFVVLIFTLSAKPITHRIYEHMDHREVVTLAKFLLLAAVILPLLPKQPVVPYLPATPFAIWVAVVAVSAISYLGYLLQRYVAPRGGYLITGLLGGLYSSTATTVVLARKSRDTQADTTNIAAAMVAASGMMYLRLLVLIGLLNPAFLRPAFIPFALLGIGAIAGSVLRMKNGSSQAVDPKAAPSQNPLELGTALLFATLFIVMLLLTKVIIHYFGTTGLQLLSFGVGFTDIDPFVLSLLKGGYQGIGMDQLASAIFIAVGSNNFLKAFYAATLGGWRRCRNAVIALLVLGGLTLGYGLAAF